MKMSPEGINLLVEASALLGIDVTAQLEQHAQLFDLFTEASQKINLTAIRLERDIVLRHFVDSLSCLKTGFLDNVGRIIDVGTGGGFPGLPLALMRPEIDFTLLDATKKKIDFVDFAIKQLSIPNVVAICQRAEVAGQDGQYRQKFDRVVTRAVGPLEVILELCLPFLEIGGVALFQKGPDGEKELLQASSVIPLLGGQLLGIEAIQLPWGAGDRRIITVRKVADTPKQYPRKGAALGRFRGMGQV